MITGAHFLLYSRDADADRRFLRDVLGFEGIDVGGGWLILALPPAEIAVHPSTGDFVQRHAAHGLLGAVLYLMCDDLAATLNSLAERGVVATEIEQESWGLRTTIRLPSGGELGLYQPTHPSPLNRGEQPLRAAAAAVRHADQKENIGERDDRSESTVTD